VDPHCCNADQEDPAQNRDADPDQAPDPGVGQPKMCIPSGKILGTPLVSMILIKRFESLRIQIQLFDDQIWKNSF
jgi:hypothetical protein